MRICLLIIHLMTGIAFIFTHTAWALDHQALAPKSPFADHGSGSAIATQKASAYSRLSPRARGTVDDLVRHAASYYRLQPADLDTLKGTLAAVVLKELTPEDAIAVISKLGIETAFAQSYVSTVVESRDDAYDGTLIKRLLPNELEYEALVRKFLPTWQSEVAGELVGHEREIAHVLARYPDRADGYSRKLALESKLASWGIAKDWEAGPAGQLARLYLPDDAGSGGQIAPPVIPSHADAIRMEIEAHLPIPKAETVQQETVFQTHVARRTSTQELYTVLVRLHISGEYARKHRPDPSNPRSIIFLVDELMPHAREIADVLAAYPGNDVTDKDSRQNSLERLLAGWGVTERWEGEYAKDFAQIHEPHEYAAVEGLVRYLRLKADWMQRQHEAFVKLYSLIGDAPITALSEADFDNMEKILGPSWIDTDSRDTTAVKDFMASALRPGLGDRWNNDVDASRNPFMQNLTTKAFKPSRECRIPFEMIVALRRSAKENNPIHLARFFGRLLNEWKDESLSRAAVLDGVLYVTKRLSDSGHPDLMGVSLENILGPAVDQNAKFLQEIGLFEDLKAIKGPLLFVHRDMKEERRRSALTNRGFPGLRQNIGNPPLDPTAFAM